MHANTESSKRTWRTVYQSIVGLLTTVPVLVAIVLAALPSDAAWAAKVAAVAAATVTGLAGATKVITTLEAVGAIPTWLTTGETLTLSESHRRALRTLFQGVVSLVTSGPILITVTLGILQAFAPDASFTDTAVAVSGSTVAGLLIATKIMTGLEESGRLPAWLTTSKPVVAPPA